MPKTPKPRVEMQIDYLNKCLNETIEEQLKYDPSWYKYDRLEVEIKRLKRMIKKEKKILYFEDDIISFDELSGLVSQGAWLIYDQTFTYKGVDYITTSVNYNLICFKKAGKGNQTEIRIYKPIVRNDERLQLMYLSWVNDFLTVERFASYYNTSLRDANDVIERGRIIHEKNCSHD